MIEDVNQEKNDIIKMCMYLNELQDYYDNEQYLLQVEDMSSFEEKNIIYFVLDKYINILTSYGILINFEYVTMYNTYRSKLIDILNIFIPGNINQLIETSIIDIREDIKNILSDDFSDDESELDENKVLELIEYLSIVEITDDVLEDLISKIELTDSYISLIDAIIDNSVDTQESGLYNSRVMLEKLRNNVYSFYSLNNYKEYYKDQDNNRYYKKVLEKIITYFVSSHFDKYMEKISSNPYENLLVVTKNMLVNLVKEDALPLSISYYTKNNIYNINKYQLLLIVVTNKILDSKWHPNYVNSNDINYYRDDMIKHVLTEPDDSIYKINDNDEIADILLTRKSIKERSGG